jgi:hypothetical protein
MKLIQPQTINAKQAELGASRFRDDWRHTRYHKRRIALYGQSEVKKIQELIVTTTGDANNGK